MASRSTRHRRFTHAIGVPVFFCDARSPWQSGTNENTNGLLRRYLPKSTHLAVYSSVELQGIADEINIRPRRSLEWQTPVEVLAARGAMTA